MQLKPLNNTCLQNPHSYSLWSRQIDRDEHNKTTSREQAGALSSPIKADPFKKKQKKKLLLTKFEIFCVFKVLFSLQEFLFGLFSRSELSSTPLALFIAAVRLSWCVWGEGCCDLSGETELAGPDEEDDDDDDDDAANWAVPIRTGLSRVIQRGNEANRIFYFETCIEIEFSIDVVVDVDDVVVVVPSLWWC